MDYSNRVNSKKGGGGVADTHETNVHTRRRLKELLTTQVLDLDNDPYVFRNHLGMLECRLCLTTHVSESSYISHLSGKKHQLNLEKRRILDAKQNQRNRGALSADAVIANKIVTISNTPKRTWTKIGRPAYKVSKIRDPQSMQTGFLVDLKLPKAIKDPLFRFMSYYELSPHNQTVTNSYISQNNVDVSAQDSQFLVISAEPYENICIAIPSREIDRPKDDLQMSENYWWFFDRDTKEFFLQFLFK